MNAYLWSLTARTRQLRIVQMRFLSRLFTHLTLLSLIFTSSNVSAAPLVGLEKVNYDFISRTKANDSKLWEDREKLLLGIKASIKYLQSPESEIAYQNFEKQGIPRELVEQSLKRFRKLLVVSKSSEELNQAMQKEFSLFKAKGIDGRGKVKFTGYFQPSYRASRHSNAEYRYPVFYLPPDFKEWDKPHPTRVQLEGYDGRGGPKALLNGYELAWLKDRFDVFMIQLQGSAVLEFENEPPVSIGFAAGTDYPFKSISSAVLKKHNVPWNNLDVFFSRNPSLFDSLISSNNRFIFFKENPQGYPLGSLGIPVVDGRSIATDKLRFPPGALGMVYASLPEFSASGRIELSKSLRLVLDHDSGSAIKGPGRVDLYIGSGRQAQRLANHLYGHGELYYLLLKA